MKITMLFVVLALLTLGLGVSCDYASRNNSSTCTVGETRNGTTVCGLNDEGVYVQSCVDGEWQDTTSCTGTDECTEDATQVGETPCNETGFFIQGCTGGAWVDTTECTENGCTPDATQVGTTADRKSVV